MRLLTKLTEDDVPFHVGTKDSKSFRELKTRVGDSIILVIQTPQSVIFCARTQAKNMLLMDVVLNQ